MYRRRVSKARATYLASLALGLATVLGAVFVTGVPSWTPLLWLLLFVGLTVFGVTHPTLEMFGPLAWRGAAGRQLVSLTFDDGPSPSTTPLVLDALRKHNVKATFFVVGSKVEAHPDLLRRIVADGHELGLHSYRHEWLYSFKSPKAVGLDIAATQRAIEAACGQRPTLFRPPVGLVSPRTQAGVERAGVTLVIWSVRGVDGVKRAHPTQVVKRILAGLHDGAIVLLHDGAEKDDFTPASVAALPTILKAVRDRGLKPVSLRELLTPAPNRV